MNYVEELIKIEKDLKKNYSLFNNVKVKTDDLNNPAESLPDYLNIFLKILETTKDEPVCFVMPRCGDIPRLVSVLYALNTFKNKLPKLINGYFKDNFKVGDIVKVFPGRHVYKYCGLVPGYEDHVFLGLMKNENEKRSFPTSELIRLEKTTATTPMGTWSTKFDNTPPPICKFLGIKSQLKDSFFQNEVIVLDCKSKYREFTEKLFLANSLQKDIYFKLSELLPFGSMVEPDALKSLWFRKWDINDPLGSVMLSVTPRSERLATYIREESDSSKSIIVNGLSFFKNAIQDFDEIANANKLVLFADENDMKTLEIIANRNCKIWKMGFEEISNGPLESDKTEGGLIRNAYKHFLNQKNISINPITCDCEILNKNYEIIWDVKKRNKRNDNENIEEIFIGLLGLLNYESGILGELDEIEKKNLLSRILDTQEKIEANKYSLTNEDYKELKQAISGFQEALEPSAKLGLEKLEKLKKYLEKEVKPDSKIALIVRDENQRKHISNNLKGFKSGQSLSIYTFDLRPDNDFFDKYILTSWLYIQKMSKLIANYGTSEIVVFTYRYEEQRLNQFKNNFKKSTRINYLSNKKKLSLLSNSSNFDDLLEETPIPVINDPEEEDLLDLEINPEAKKKGSFNNQHDSKDLNANYVGFIGKSYSYLTENHKVVIATDIINGRDGNSRSITEGVFKDIELGDFVVFPDNGVQEIIQETANWILGPEVETLRKNSHLWKDVIIRTGFTPEGFCYKASQLGTPRQIHTVKNWFSSKNQIAPGTLEDILLIAKVTESKELEKKARQVWEGIEKIRLTHRNAGKYLHKKLIEQLPNTHIEEKENGIKIDLEDLGSAWIVQVEMISSQSERRSMSEVNQLLWEL